MHKLLKKGLAGKNTVENNKARKWDILYPIGQKRPKQTEILSF